MLHAHVTPKCIKIIGLWSIISGVYIQKNGLVYNRQSVKTYYYIICYWSSIQKTNHIKLIALLIIFNLTDLFFKTRHVLKNKSIKFDKGSLNTGTTKYFLIWQTNSPSQVKFRVHFFMVHFHMAPVNSFYLNMWPFWWGIELHHSQVSTLFCQCIFPIHDLNSHFLIVPPCAIAHCELILSYRCWH